MNDVTLFLPLFDICVVNELAVVLVVLPGNHFFIVSYTLTN